MSTSTLPLGRTWPAPLRLALTLLGVVSCALAGVEIALFASGGVHPVWPFTAFAVVGLLFFASGLVGWARRPSNCTGALLCVCGVSVLAAVIGNAPSPVFATVGAAAAELPIAVMLHLLLAFPSGRLPDARCRQLTGAGYAVAVGLQAPQYLFADDPALPRWLRLADRPDLVVLAHRSQSIAAALLTVLISAVLVVRLRRADPTHRRVLAAVEGYGVFALLFLMFSTDVLRPLLRLSPIALFELQIAVLAGVPIAFLAGLLHGGFARMRELYELAAWLGATDSDRPGLQEALRATLGDPGLELLFWLPATGGYVDEAGRPARLPPAVLNSPARGRAVVPIDGPVGRVGAISYDAALIADAAMVRAAGRILALAVERERLTVQLLASQQALRESRSRIVAAADQERRRVARDLHDGLQARLVVLALRAGTLVEQVNPECTSDATQLCRELENTIVELRGFVHGVLPDLLEHRGLEAAVEELLDQTPLGTRLDLSSAAGRLPIEIETAGYFLIAEALANTVKHARANRLAVRLTRTADSLRIDVHDDGIGGATVNGRGGLRGLADRVDALGGKLLLDSPPGKGTRLQAEIPCAS